MALNEGQEFLSSLDRDELLDLIQHWSQASATRDEPDQTDESSSSLSLPLAQLQPAEEEEDDEDENLAFGDYETYFATKTRNQRLEDAKFVEWDEQRRKVQGLDATQSQIFQGCKIYVNGYTRPSIATIHRLVILHGGEFIHHLSSKGAATHVVATGLTPRKQNEFRRYKVVRPEWITESVEKGLLMKWSDYSVLSVDYGQKRLDFGHVAGDGIAEEANADEDGEHGIDEDGSAEDDGEHGSDEDREEVQNNGQDDRQYGLEIAPPTQPQEPIHPSNQTTHESIAIDAKHPDFLHQFFSKSRLHHLSTWKADLRASFLQMVMEKQSHHRKPRTRNHRIILHVDFDCFFATASALNRPDLDFATTPICVSYGGKTGSRKDGSTADIASCNYRCRYFGIRNGMWVHTAKERCPELICLDYDFPRYESISKQFYEILIGLKADCILPVSIDEALVEISLLIDADGDIESQVQKFTSDLRRDVYLQTKCTVSVGVSTNVLLAKLALRRAKPDGVFTLFDNVDEFLRNIPVRDLPGVGDSIVQRLQSQLFQYSTDVITLHELRAVEKRELERVFGQKTGLKLFNYSRGIDPTSIDISENPQEFMRKSVSIDINWGIRFDTIAQIDDFLFRVSKELCERLTKIKMNASTVTLKLLKRRPGTPMEPPKYLGCGIVDAYSKSSNLGVASDEYRVIGMEARILFRNIGCDPKELRGVSIQVSKLTVKGKDGQQRLPFAKGLKRKLDAEQSENVKEVEQTPNKSMEMTQFVIPSDVDSSVLEELPSSVREKIRAQRERDLYPVVEVPRDVDLKVFQQLPLDIQEELLEELRRRNIKITPQTPRKNKAYMQQVFTQHGGAGFVRVIGKSPKKSPRKSPRKTSPIKIVMNNEHKMDKLDEEVLKELPSSLREKIIEEWEEYNESIKTEAQKLKERAPAWIDNGAELTMDDFHVNMEAVPFQKRTRPLEILNLIDSWVFNTKAKGPHARDVALFEKYIHMLKAGKHPMYWNVVQRLQLLARMEQPCKVWMDIIQSITTIP